MKRIILLLVAVLFAQCAFAQTPADTLRKQQMQMDSIKVHLLTRINQHTAPCYKLYPTENMWTFLELKHSLVVYGRYSTPRKALTTDSVQHLIRTLWYGMSKRVSPDVSNYIRPRICTTSSSLTHSMVVPGKFNGSPKQKTV